MGLTVAEATEAHLREVAAIYATAAEQLPATFDLEGPPIEWWREVMAGDELLVAIDGSEVAGFAKTGAFKTRAAYDSTREVSAYVAEHHRGKGVGHALYGELLPRLDSDPKLLLAVAGVTVPNPASEALHRGHGFTEVGVFEDVGVKFGKAWSVRWYQRPLNGGGAF